MFLVRMPKEGPGGPIEPHLRSVAQSLSEQGYVRLYRLRLLMLSADFSRWLKRRRVRTRSICSAHAAQYLRCRYRHRQANRNDWLALRHLMAFLRVQRVIPAEKCAGPPPTPAVRCAQAYEQYLRQDRALAKPTIINYIPCVCDFLKDRFGVGPVKLSSLRAEYVIRFVQRRAPRFHWKPPKMI